MAREAQIRMLAERLALTQDRLQAMLAGEVDAVIDPISSTPILLRQAQLALQESETRYRCLMANMPAIVCELSPDGRLLFVNGAIERLTGYTPDELGSNGLWDVLTRGEQRARAEKLLAELQKNDVVRYELDVTAKDGRILWLEVNSANRFRGKGVLTNIILLAVDITRLKKAEAALHETSGRLLTVQDAERRRLARELHDGTAQALAGLAMNLSLLTDGEQLHDRQRTALREAQVLNEKAIQEIRTLSYLLHPPLLDESGLLAALQWYVRGFAQRSGIDVQLQAAPRLERLPQEMELTLFRIVQEALSNIHRHSKSHEAKLRLRRTSRGIGLEIADHGRGIPDEVLSKNNGTCGVGVGLAGMSERVRQLHGKFEIISGGQGTTIKVEIPCPRETAMQTRAS